MINIDKFEVEFKTLQSYFPSGSYEYTDPNASFSAITKAHFENIAPPHYGVYVIRQHATRQVIYIGKSGTIDPHGNFKSQDIPHRLQNVREKRHGQCIFGKQWFSELVREVGPLSVEYVVLPQTYSPALAETRLLQAYLNEHQKLPDKNKSL